jgi:hypothetical protein
MMPDLRKTLIVAHVHPIEVARKRIGDDAAAGDDKDDAATTQSPIPMNSFSYTVHELAFATEHAPFRHKHIPQGVGTQVKPQQQHRQSSSLHAKKLT